MAVKNPVPCLWTPVMPNRFGKIERLCCPYMKRFNLPCHTSRNLCRQCYMKQQNLRSSEVEHVCDRCGFTLSGADNIFYVKLENRDGGIVGKAELCEACASQVIEWLNNEDFFHNFYGDEE